MHAFILMSLLGSALAFPPAPVPSPPPAPATQCSGLPSGFTAGSQEEFSWTQKDTNSALGSYSRQYMIRIPEGYTGTEKTSIMFYFHGWGQSLKQDDWKAMANKHNAIIVNPGGMAENSWAGASWNCGFAGRTDVCRNPTDAEEYSSCQTIGKQGKCNCFTCYDDVQFVDDLAAYLQAALCIDSDRIYGTGASNGGIFLYYLLPQLAARGSKLHFNAIASYYGANFQNMDDVPASVAGTSVFSFHGALDVEVPPGGGRSTDGYLYVAEATTLSEYAKVNGCSATETAISTPYDKSGDKQTCHEHMDCKGARIVRCIYPKLGHSLWLSYSEEVTFYFFNSQNSTMLV